MYSIDACMRSKRVVEFCRAQALQIAGGTDLFYQQRVSNGFYLGPSPEHHRASLDSWRKDLGLEASSLRHAARLIIFEIMRSFFLGFKGAGD